MSTNPNVEDIESIINININNNDRLNLSNKNITILPESIGNLVDLMDLELYNNQITILPESIGNLTNLSALNLENNQITSLPESFGNLTNLNDLDLSKNKLTTLPESFGNLTNLNGLDINENPLTTLPESFGNMTNLIGLEIRGLETNLNKITTLPESFGNLIKLTRLDLALNAITSLPESFGNFTNLTTLYLHNNEIITLPESFGNLSSLEYLDLENNQIASLPESLGDLTQLEVLNLKNNQITSLPESLGDLSLEVLNLENNPNLESLPNSFGNLWRLQNLNLTNTGISRNPLSPEIRSLLRRLHRNGTDIEGIDEEILYDDTDEDRDEDTDEEIVQVNARQIHEESAKINYDLLISFLKEKTGNIEFPFNLIYPDYIKENLSEFINQLNENEETKQTLISGLENIMTQRLNRLNYNDISINNKKALFYAIEFAKLQSYEFKDSFIKNFINDCNRAYEGDNGMTCAAGAIERFWFMLIPACTTIISMEGEDDELINMYNTLIGILTYNKDVYINQYIKDWYVLHKNTGNDKFVNMSEDDIKENLKTFVLEKFPENDKAYVQEKLNEIIPALSFDEDDFVYNGGRKRITSKKNKNKTKTKKHKKIISKSKTNKKRRPEAKKVTKKRKTIRRNNKTKRRNPRKQ